MQVRLEILGKGDSVLNVWENNVAVRKTNGDVEILHFDLDAEGLLRLSNNSILITRGDGVVRAIDEDSSIEFGTF